MVCCSCLGSCLGQQDLGVLSQAMMMGVLSLYTNPLWYARFAARGTQAMAWGLPTRA
jgi:hypothetical protein